MTGPGSQWSMPLVGSLLIGAALIPLHLYANAGGPVAGKAGVPGEYDCTVCHSGKANSGPGGVRVNFPGRLEYIPGVTQHLRVTVADPGQKRWGFQLTARQAKDPAMQAGSLSPADGDTQVICAGKDLVERSDAPCTKSTPLQYIEQTEAGARLGQLGSAVFEFDWTPPATDIGPVVIYVAANAADGDNTPAHDHIYTTKYALDAGVSPAQPKQAAAIAPRPSRPPGLPHCRFAGPRAGFRWVRQAECGDSPATGRPPAWARLPRTARPPARC